MAKVIIYHQHGDPAVLTLTDREIPSPGAGQVRIRVRAAAVNPIDIKLRRGDFADIFSLPMPSVPGLDAAGIVDAVGDGVCGLAVGDGVFGTAVTGSYAQSALMTGAVPIPDGLTWDEASILPTIGETAYRVLEHMKLEQGATLMVHGASGGVGSLVTQLAVQRGISVVGSCADADAEWVRSLGATPVRYGAGVVERVRSAVPQRVDAVLDTWGQGLLPVSIELAGSPDRVMTIADLEAGTYGVRTTGLDPSDRTPEALPILAAMVAEKRLLLPDIHAYSLAAASDAHQDIEARRLKGRAVLIP
ncbi:NADP-dependent oxidoreductase [Streptomyces sp. NPDC099088]|uniref:NADP-dependent oxidoreductase n=1 Tax=Streptomyces sp. NPDC099088 TaxID=3366101 RepID=UPI0037F1C478